MTTEWMNDTSLSHIPKEKLSFLQELAFESNGIDPKKRMTYFLSLATKARQANIHFSNEEMECIIAALKKHATGEELAKIEQLLKVFREKRLG
ncbi:MAG: hypothetical protein R3Y67_07095 [Eubacteriales bacterium]